MEEKRTYRAGTYEFGQGLQPGLPQEGSRVAQVVEVDGRAPGTCSR
jgi:hypothetical protein